MFSPQQIADLRTLEPYTYQETITFAAAATIGTSMNGEVRISEFDFVCTRVLATCRVASTGVVIQAGENDGGTEIGGEPDLPFLIQITQTGRQRLLSNEPIDLRSWVDKDGRRPLAQPLLITASSQITFAVSNLKASAAGTQWVLRIAFDGFHINPGR